jgi:very-short-patch-repair endonuclease
VSFKRQVPLGDRYIADFFAPSVRLVMEVDGGVHRSRPARRGREEFCSPRSGDTLRQKPNGASP